MNRPPTLPLPAHPDVRIEAEERVWDGRFPLDRIRFRNRRFDGTFSGPRTWEVWRRGRAAAMLPYDPVADAVVLIEQFRLPALAAGLDPIVVELPAGMRDPGESDETTIRREMVEETGLTTGRLRKITDILLSSGGADEVCALFVGEVAAPRAVGPDGLCGVSGLASEHEDIRLRVWSAERACAAALDGAFVNSAAAIALLWLNARRDELRREWTKA